MRRERGDHTLCATELVNEAYLRLINQKNIQWQNRKQFFAISTQIMRRILVDYAKQRSAKKRGGDSIKYSIDDFEPISKTRVDQFLTLDEALSRLNTYDELSATVIELQYFTGLTLSEIAEVLKVSESTVSRKLRFAKAWLYRELKD